MSQQRNQCYQHHRMCYLVPKGEVLELGCHIGFNLIYYAGQGFNCTGVEISQSLIDIAEERIAIQPQEIQNRITLVKSWIEDF